MTSYGQFCPVAKAAEVLCPRWAVLVVRELVSGSTRFGDIQRGLPGCPPATLVKRLRELEAAGVVTRTSGAGGVTYGLTAAGADLYPVVEAFGTWGQRWARSTYGADELDAEALLWDVRRFLDPSGLGVERAVLQLEVRRPDRGLRLFWVVVSPAGVDLCVVDPERPVDVVLQADLRALTRAWMGDTTFAGAVAAGDIVLSGPARLVRRIPEWWGQHPVLAAVPQATPAS